MKVKEQQLTFFPFLASREKILLAVISDSDKEEKKKTRQMATKSKAAELRHTFYFPLLFL
jgi:hypothetical protein